MKAFFRQNRLFAICGILAAAIVLTAVFAPWIDHTVSGAA